MPGQQTNTGNFQVPRKVSFDQKHSVSCEPNLDPQVWWEELGATAIYQPLCKYFTFTTTVAIIVYNTKHQF